MATETKRGNCGKCDGKGRINAFGHVEAGKCFWCGGTGSVSTSRRLAGSERHWALYGVKNCIEAIRGAHGDHAPARETMQKLLAQLNDPTVTARAEAALAR